MTDALYQYCLRLGDTALLQGQRLAEWCGHGPFLEEDIALTNTALDLFGHANMFYRHAVTLNPAVANEDQLAFLRDAHEFRNPLMVELPKGDFAFTLLRQYLLDAYNDLLYAALSDSTHTPLAEIARKAAKETAYHLQRSLLWLRRLSLGTDESHARMQSALDELWFYSPELFEAHDLLQSLQQEGVAPDGQVLQRVWSERVLQQLQSCRLEAPQSGWVATGGWQGEHSEHLGYLLAEMQFLQRAYPGCEW